MRAMISVWNVYLPDRLQMTTLSVELFDLTSSARVIAEVVWGHPSGHTEASFRDDWQSSAQWPEATPKVVAELVESFPSLVLAFRAAVQRGVPPANSQ
jgi:hypothetical protein